MDLPAAPRRPAEVTGIVLTKRNNDRCTSTITVFLQSNWHALAAYECTALLRWGPMWFAMQKRGSDLEDQPDASGFKYILIS